MSQQDDERFMDLDEGDGDRPRRRSRSDEPALEFSSADYRNKRELPPLVFDGTEYDLRSDIDSAVLLGVDGNASVMDVYQAVMTDESFEDFRDWVDDESPPIAMLTEAAEKVAKAYRSGNRRARRSRSSRSRSRR